MRLGLRLPRVHLLNYESPLRRGLSRRPSFRNIHIRAIKFGDGGATEQPQRAVEVGAQDFDGAVNAGLSGGGEAIGIGAATEHGTSA